MEADPLPSSPGRQNIRLYHHCNHCLVVHPLGPVLSELQALEGSLGEVTVVGSVASGKGNASPTNWRLQQIQSMTWGCGQ